MQKLYPIIRTRACTTDRRRSTSKIYVPRMRRERSFDSKAIPPLSFPRFNFHSFATAKRDAEGERIGWMAVIPRRIRAWGVVYQRNRFFPLCAPTNREDLLGDELQRLLLFFSDDHFPRELSFLLWRIDRLSNFSIGAISFGGKEMFFHLPSSVR